MDPNTIDVPPLDLRAAVGAVNDDTRTVELTFTTGADVIRFDWMTGKRFIERLSVDPGHIRMQRLNGGAPLLNAHSAYSLADQIGIVDSASVDGKTGRATVRFSKRADVEPFYQDVRDGIIRNVSVGYRVHKFEESEAKGNTLPVRLATDWEPYEISMVPMGADAGARVRSSREVETNPCVIVRAAEEAPMVEETKTPTPAAAVVDEAAVRTAAIEGERARATAIQSAVRTAKLDPSVAANMVQRGITIDVARSEIFAKLAEKDEQVRTDSTIEVGADAQDKFVRGATNWLLVKSGMAPQIARAQKVEVSTIDPGEFRGMSLVELARETLVRSGRAVRGTDKMRLVADAFTIRGSITQSTSDFATLLENVMHKMLQAAYGITPDTWSRFCAQGTVSDFRAHARYRMGTFGALDAVNESGEFKRKAITDASKETITAGTKGNIINVSRQMIVNDDMGAFASLLSKLGRAAKLSVEIDVYALLAQNGGLGPTMGDGVVLFNAAHNNISAGAALSAAAIDSDRVQMAQQKDKDSNDFIDLRPAILLVPVGLGGSARIINQSQYDPDTIANKPSMKPNAVVGLFSDVVDTPRLTGTRRYLFADKNVAPTIEVAFLEGQTEPVLETKDGWDVDGAEMKVRYDYAVGAVDFRGAVTNAGV